MRLAVFGLRDGQCPVVKINIVPAQRLRFHAPQARKQQQLEVILDDRIVEQANRLKPLRQLVRLGILCRIGTAYSPR